MVRPVNHITGWKVILILVALFAGHYLDGGLGALLLLVAVMPGCLR
jgi:hypothetical protein